MKFFVYEFVTGGGLLHSRESESTLAHLRDEGLAMFRAIVADLSRREDAQLVGLWDGRLASPPAMPIRLQTVSTEIKHRTAFDTLARSSDATLVIAPETGNQLHLAASRVLEVGGHLLGPDPAVIALASDKHALAKHLARHGVPVPSGVALRCDEPIPKQIAYPAVMKPLEGAGARQTYLVPDAETAARLRPPMPIRLESYHAGVSVSVAFLCGPGGNTALLPCMQIMETVGGLIHYRGGSLPLETSLSERASGLAQRAIDSLPSPRGYLGVDLILGPASGGTDDVVLEINPRLTTSYVGLRAAMGENLAGLMLDGIAGKLPSFSARLRAITFTADGKVWLSDQASVFAKLSDTRPSKAPS